MVLKITKQKREGYLIPFQADGRQVIKVGVVFNREKRTIGRWKTDSEAA
jgi:hypothetical protein